MSQVLVREVGKMYYFSHETVKRFEAGTLLFETIHGRPLVPKYTGAGLAGMNGKFVYKSEVKG